MTNMKPLSTLKDCREIFKFVRTRLPYILLRHKTSKDEVPSVVLLNGVTFKDKSMKKIDSLILGNRTMTTSLLFKEYEWLPDYLFRENTNIEWNAFGVPTKEGNL